MKIGRRKIGQGHPVFIVAELSGNHGGEFEYALALVRAAASAGADAIKLQTYTADTITLKCKKPDFRIRSDSPWKDHGYLYELYENAFTPWEWQGKLFSEAKKLGLEAFSSPFDLSSVEYLETLDVPAYKIASPEITDIKLLETVARKGKPVIVSTGLAEANDIALAIDTLREAGAHNLILLKCTTAYPAPFEEINLRMIPEFRNRFRCLAGLSDHTLGFVASLGAVALGACLIEKHFVLSREDKSVDSFFSLDQTEFSELVKTVRDLERALGKVDYSLTPTAKKNILSRRSLYVSASIRNGERFSNENIRSVRPGFGLHPKYLKAVLGKRAVCDLESGDRLDWHAVEGGTELSFPL